MRINFKEHTWLFRFIIWLDRGLNVMTGGTFQECLSTRAYVQAEEKGSKLWLKTRSVINWIFWDGHCRDSFIWEMGLKRKFIEKHKHLEK